MGLRFNAIYQLDEKLEAREKENQRAHRLGLRKKGRFQGARFLLNDTFPL